MAQALGNGGLTDGWLPRNGRDVAAAAQGAASACRVAVWRLAAQRVLNMSTADAGQVKERKVLFLAIMKTCPFR